MPILRAPKQREISADRDRSLDPAKMINLVLDPYRECEFEALRDRGTLVARPRVWAELPCPLPCLVAVTSLIDPKYQIHFHDINSNISHLVHSRLALTPRLGSTGQCRCQEPTQTCLSTPLSTAGWARCACFTNTFQISWGKLEWMAIFPLFIPGKLNI